MPVARGVSPQAIALRKRLASGRLLPQDRERIKLALDLRDLRAQGLTFAECARRLGVSKKLVEGFVNGQVYDTILAHHERQEAGADGDGRARGATDKRGHVRRLASPALDRLEANLQGDNARAADRAMEIVLEANGLLEPEVARPVIHIPQLVVNQQVQISLKDDRVFERERAEDVAVDTEALPSPDEGPPRRRANGDR
jgi:transcriptional regulator with XRE-family HTH domain